MFGGTSSEVRFLACSAWVRMDRHLEWISGASICATRKVVVQTMSGSQVGETILTFNVSPSMIESTVIVRIVRFI